MKYIFAFLISYQMCLGQSPPVAIPIDSTTGKAQWQQVYVLEKPMKADAIINSAKTWTAKTYNDANRVIQQFDPQAGIMIIKGLFPITFPIEGKFVAPGTLGTLNVNHTLTIEAKPGRYRATMEGFIIKAPAPANMEIAFNPIGCVLSGYEYGRYALEELDRAGYGSLRKQMLKQYEKNPELGMEETRRRCQLIKLKTETILNDLNSHLVKAAKESDW